ncbi:MAG: hypothetical protein AAF799_22565 [Myxococcota bacterium]
MRGWIADGRGVAVIGAWLAIGGCSDPVVSISGDGLSPAQRASGQVSEECAVVEQQLRCWFLEPHEGDQQLLMLRDELEPALPLPAVPLGTSAPVRGFDTALTSRSRCAALGGEGVKCWGYNEGHTTADFDDYQLGRPEVDIVVGDEADERGTGLPFVALGATDVVSVTQSQYGYCALFESGGVKCWGSGNPTSGLGDLETRGDEPDEMGDALPFVDLGTDVHAVGLVGMFTHVCVWTDDGRVKCWGHNDLSQLGTPPSEPIGDEPGEMGDAQPFVDLGPDFVVVQVTAGSNYSCALSDDGRVKCWGANATPHVPGAPNDEEGSPTNYGRLGQGDRRESMPATGDALPPVDLGGTDAKVVGIAAGSTHTCALFDHGRVKCWGSGGGGKLGYGSTDNIGDEPGEMGDALPFVDLGDHVAVKLGCTQSRSCVLTDEPSVLCWGPLGTDDGLYRPGATPGTMGDALIPMATPEELGVAGP